MLRTSLALAVCASAVAMVPTGSLTASMRLRPVAFRCSMSSAADDTAVARAALRQTAFVLAAVLAWLAASAVVFEYAEGWHDEL